MKISKFLSVLIILASFSILATITVSAIPNTGTVKWGLTQERGEYTDNRAGYCYYDPGSSWPYDDVRASTTVYLANGMSGTIGTYITVGTRTISQTDTHGKALGNINWNIGDLVYSGQDYADSCRYTGSRTNTVGTESFNVTVTK